jgi:hypothetical protein
MTANRLILLFSHLLLKCARNTVSLGSSYGGVEAHATKCPELRSRANTALDKPCIDLPLVFCDAVLAIGSKATKRKTGRHTSQELHGLDTQQEDKQ